MDFFTKRIYLDIAASTPVRSLARRAFLHALHVSGNPGAPHEEGRQAKRILEEARTSIARMAEVKTEQVVFTGSATEANNLAIRGYVKRLLHEGRSLGEIHLIYSAGAHASIVHTMRALEKEGASIDEVPLHNGDIDTKELARLLKKETCLVSIEAVSSETGAQFDTRGVKRVLTEFAPDRCIAFHVDASQVPLIESFSRSRLGADLMTLDAQKVGGVRGIGALIFTNSAQPAPIIFGGGQERGLRAGTENPALAASFAAALAEASKERSRFSLHALRMRTLLIKGIEEIEKCEVNSGKKQAPHIVNLSLHGRDTDYLVALLDKEGFAVSTKSACETDSPLGSRGVFALFQDKDRALSTLRISFDLSLREGAIRRFVRALIRAVAFLDQQRG